MRGTAFRSWTEASIPTGGIPTAQYFVMDIGDRDTALISRIISSDRSNVRYESMAGAVVATYGADVPIYNMSQKSFTASKNRIRFCTVSTPGIPVDLDIVRGSAGQGNRTSGSTFTPEDFRVFKANQQIVVRGINPDTVDPASLLIYLKWIEFKWP
ncbi:hypothetical protein D3C87_1384190 [compost metagenome]